jgi:hypothetical protein
VPFGGKVGDSATVSGLYRPSGTVTFDLYRGTACTGTPVFEQTVILSPNSTATSGLFEPAAADTYTWTATYNGNEYDNPVTSQCGTETVDVTPQVMTGSAAALVLDATLLGQTLIPPVTVEGVGPVTTTQTTADNECAVNVNVIDVAISGDVCANVDTRMELGSPSHAKATSSVASLSLGVPGVPTIVIHAVAAKSITTCNGSTGTVRIAELKIGNQVLIGKPMSVAPDTTFNVGIVSVVLNEQIPVTGPDRGLTVNAVHITVDALGINLNLIASTAESDIGNCATSSTSRVR